MLICAGKTTLRQFVPGTCIEFSAKTGPRITKASKMKVNIFFLMNLLYPYATACTTPRMVSCASMRAVFAVAVVMVISLLVCDGRNTASGNPSVMSNSYQPLLTGKYGQSMGGRYFP